MKGSNLRTQDVEVPIDKCRSIPCCTRFYATHGKRIKCEYFSRKWAVSRWRKGKRLIRGQQVQNCNSRPGKHGNRRNRPCRDRVSVARDQDIQIYSCYWYPNLPPPTFEDFLLRLEHSIRGFLLPVIVAGDFNSHSPKWDALKEDAWGSWLTDMLVSLSLLLYLTFTGCVNCSWNLGSSTMLKPSLRLDDSAPTSL